MAIPSRLLARPYAPPPVSSLGAEFLYPHWFLAETVSLMSWKQFFTLLDAEPSLTEPLARAFTLFPDNIPSLPTDNTAPLLAAHCRNEKILSLFVSAVLLVAPPSVPFAFVHGRLGIQAAVANDNVLYLRLIFSELNSDPGFALHCAATFNRPKIAKWLIETYPDDLRDACVKPLAIATKHGYIDVIAALTEGQRSLNQAV